MSKKQTLNNYMKLRKHNGDIVCVNSTYIKDTKMGSTRTVQLVLKSNRIIVGEPV